MDIQSVTARGSEVRPTQKSVVARQRSKSLDGGWRENSFPRAIRIRALPKKWGNGQERVKLTEINVKWPCSPMKKIKRWGQETQQMPRERFLALLLTGLAPYPLFFSEGSSIVCHKTSLSFLILFMGRQLGFLCKKNERLIKVKKKVKFQLHIYFLCWISNS